MPSLANRNASVFASIALWALCCCQVVACERPLVVSYSGDWAPYFVNSGHDQYAGTDFLLFSHVMQALPCPYVVLPMHEKRAQREQQKGTVDVFIGATFTQERAEQFHFSVPYRNGRIGFAYISDNETERSRPLTLSQRLTRGEIAALNIDGFFGDEVTLLKRQFPDQFRHGFGIAERVAMLMAGQVSIVVDDITALCAYILRVNEDTNTLPTLALGAEILSESEVRYMFNKLTVDIDMFDRFEQQLKREIAATPLPTNADRGHSCQPSSGD